jgi:hypothetical protein
MGPSIIFDKSTLQSLSVDEAVWLDHFFLSNITPLFFVETLADLEKQIRGGRTPEQVVGNLAEKTPVHHGGASMFHAAICLAELIGRAIPLDGRIVVGNPKEIRAGTQKAVFFEEAPEVRALRRWEQGEFLTVERMFAKGWRTMLTATDLRAQALNVKTLSGGRHRARDFAEAKSWVDRAFELDGQRYYALKSALDLLQLSDSFCRRIVARWKREGMPKLSSFAPYTAHVLGVELFFQIALGSDLISPDRPSNRTDITYLHYLPFCIVFTSNDRLHERTAPLFLRPEQTFVKGTELKADFARLDAYYAALPEKERSQGVWRFAKHPPIEGDFLTTRLWDSLGRKWRQRVIEPEARTPEQDEMIMQRLRPLLDAKREAVSDSSIDLEQMDQLIIERRVPISRGKWRILPPGVEAIKGKDGR